LREIWIGQKVKEVLEAQEAQEAQQAQEARKAREPMLSRFHQAQDLQAERIKEYKTMGFFRREMQQDRFQEG